ncbi:MAG: hypothetical protein GX796_13240 [Clostridiaceae bacterium]|jgi:hypothetical protein|nr:hypothetical protein [Clostridiaceae bacterium]
MDKKKALEILELKDDVSSEEIEKRIAVLYKKFKHGGLDNRGYTIEDVEKAYKTVSGITYTDAEEEKKKELRKQHPNPILKLLKVDEEKARNFIYYYRWHGIAILMIIVAIVLTINSLANREEPNLKIIIGGDLYISDSQVIEDEISLKTNGSINAQVQNVYLTDDGNSQMEIGMQTKFTVELIAGNNDVFILDEAKYLQYVSQGAFKPVEELLGDISSLGIDIKLNEDLFASIESDTGNEVEKELYGIDISDNKMLREAGVTGKRMILACGHSGENSNNTIIFLNKLLE